MVDIKEKSSHWAKALYNRNRYGGIGESDLAFSYRQGFEDAFDFIGEAIANVLKEQILQRDED